MPQVKWHGVTMDEAGRVVGLALEDNNMTGALLLGYNVRGLSNMVLKRLIECARTGAERKDSLHSRGGR